MKVKTKCCRSDGTIIWATSWQNQQCGCATSEDSDQPGHPPSLIRVFTVRIKNACVLRYPLSAQRRGCPGWSESSLGAHSLCWFCHEVAHLDFVFRPLSLCFLPFLLNVLTKLNLTWNDLHLNWDTPWNKQIRACLTNTTLYGFTTQAKSAGKSTAKV